ncbi:type IX secretion system protein PorQ [Flavobacteriaceae bacterium Ap0902]|nr:type IX secretion system protein PorQ [Flavobacteriaceae bacterium Ap0902]
MHYFRVLLFFFMGSMLMAQDGTRVFEFLNITTSPRQAALGGNAQSMWDSDPNMTLWNPALMNPKSHNQLAMNYVGYLADIQFGTMSYVYQWDRENFFSIHGQYVDYGNFLQTDQIGNITGDFTAKDAAIVLGYARNLNDFFTVGINAKYIHSQIESYTSQGAAMDIGIVLHDIDYDTNVSLIARNIGYQFQSYDNIRESLPLQINLGVSHKLEHVPIELSGTLHDLQKFDISEQELDNGQSSSNIRKVIDHVSLGAELFPERGFNLRVGYNFKRGNELGSDLTKNFSGLTAGFGLRVSAFKFEFAHARYNSSANVNHMGISVDIERLIDRRFY